MARSQGRAGRAGLGAFLVGLGVVAGLAPARAVADEGMWTFNDFPAARVQSRYGFTPTAAWLEHVRLSSLRIAGGCSASAVSAQGLVMTNHHCARSCIETLSGLDRKDYNATGFLARAPAEEKRCQGMELNQLEEISDVTARVTAATTGLAPDAFHAAQKAAIAAIETACTTGPAVRCDVVSLYRGGRYDLYRYRRLQDVRLVFAPEDAIAFFGGDPDNFTFPRYDLDVTFLRAYGADGKPMPMAHHFAWSDGSLREGDLTFVSGNPGGTSRQFTLAQIDDDRDRRLPQQIARSAELRGFLLGYQLRGAEQRRHSETLLFGYENRLKVLKGQAEALASPDFHAALAAREQDFRARVAADPALARRYGDVWDVMGATVLRAQALRKPYDVLERGIVSELFQHARRLVRYAAEAPKPNGERLAEFTDARWPQLRQSLLAERPLYQELEIATLGWSLAKLREDLGPDDALVRRVFGSASAEEVARAAVRGTRLGEPANGYRQALLAGGPAAIEAAHDPMLELARALDGPARAVRAKMENEVEGPLRQAQERLAQARSAAYSEPTYPDATFSPRLSYGSVAGYVEAGRAVPAFTAMGGAFARHTGAAPFALPATWLKARPKIDPATPMNLVTTNDIIGGNSGSPMINRAGEIVGLVFDGNIQSLGGEFGFDAGVNRAVAVSSAALLEALDKVYGADRLLAEIAAPPPRPRAISAVAR